MNQTPATDRLSTGYAQPAPFGAAPLLSLLRLGSPALPIGGFSYSQGLETAHELGWVSDEHTTGNWIESLLLANVGRFEAPLCRALFAALRAGDERQAFYLQALYLSSRETAELRAETEQMGSSLLHMLAGLTELDARLKERIDAARARPSCALPYAWGLAAIAFGLDEHGALSAYLWAWLENQVMAAIKAVPLGQQAGQRLFSRLAPALARAIDDSAAIEPSNWSNFAPGFAIASSRHETQYSRLFRS
jgi:urease accessory protein